MKLRQSITILFLVAVSVLLAACGGGTSGSKQISSNQFTGCGINGVSSCPPGGSGTGGGAAGDITETNAKAVASSIVKSLDRLDRMNHVVAELGKIAMLNLKVPSDYPDPSIEHSIISGDPCINTGSSYSLTWRYVSPASGSLSNSTYAFTFTECQINDEILNGTYTLTDFTPGTLYTGPSSTSWDMSATVAFTNNAAMRDASNINDTVGLSGQLPGYAATYDTGHTELQFTANQLTLNDLGTGGGTSELFNNYNMIIDDNPVSGINHQWSNLAGTLVSSVTGNNITLSMPSVADATVDWLNSDTVPSAGRIDAQATLTTSMQIYLNSKNSAQLTVTDSASSVSIPTINVSWTDLLAGNI